MKDQRKIEIRVGITVIISILVFLWILGWAKNFSFVSDNKITTIAFDNVAGLEVGDNVTVNGVREGNVKELMTKENKVYVTVSLNNSISLNEDASFQVAMLDLMGGKRIDIEPGSSGIPFDYSKVHEGKFSADIPSVMSMVGDMQDDMASTLKDIKVTLNSLNNYLTDEKLHSDVKSSLSNLSSLTEKINLILDQNSSQIKQLIENSNQLTKNAKSLIDENKSNLSSSLSNLNTTLQKTDTLISKLNLLADQTTNKQNNLGRILYDDEFYKNLGESIKQLNDLTKILIQQLKDEGVNVDAHISIF
ncbi:MAG TPA: MlaD family protein [Ignavibacteriaceae bacterium]|nr:MlaD family protein [Ignavibacteriaceae bacterium]